jgi:hypothetical protein
MKVQMAAATAILLLSSCATLDTHNARVYKDSPVIFENDLGLAVREEDNTITPYTYNGTNPDEWYQYNFRTPGVDEKEAKQLRFLAVGLVGDIASTRLKLSQGCVEKNVLAKALPPAAMVGVSAINFGLYYFPAKGSTIYEATKHHDSKYIAAGAIFKNGLTVKNLLTKC